MTETEQLDFEALRLELEQATADPATQAFLLRAAQSERAALREALGAARADALECAAAATSAGLPRSWAGDFEAIARRCDVPLGGLVLPGLERGGVQANDGFARLCTGCGVAEGEDHQPECRHLLAGRVANRTGWHCNACNSSGAGVFAIRDGAAVCPICLSEGKPGGTASAPCECPPSECLLKLGRHCRVHHLTVDHALASDPFRLNPPQSACTEPGDYKGHRYNCSLLIPGGTMQCNCGANTRNAGSTD